MPIPALHPLHEQTVQTVTNSIASTPLACVVEVPFAGRLDRINAVSHGAFTTDCSVAIAIITPAAAGVAPGSGTAVSGSPLILTASNSAAGTSVQFSPGARTFVGEGDLIVFTPSGSTGTTIGGTFEVTIGRA
jgi:hypothetical protein